MANSLKAVTNFYCSTRRMLGLALTVACSLPLTAMMATANTPLVGGFATQSQGHSIPSIHAVGGSILPVGDLTSAVPLSLPTSHHIFQSLIHKPLSGQSQHNLASANNPGASLNLTSAQLSFRAGSLGNFSSLTIDVGGRQETVNLSTKLTAAELVAVQQSIATSVGSVPGARSIVLSSSGTASGGTIFFTNGLLSALNSALNGSISSLTIAQHVTLVDSVGSINLAGKLVNFGSIETASSINGSTDLVRASRIINEGGGSISSYSGGGSGSTNSLLGANVALVAFNSLSNIGTVSSAGNLSITAPLIVNIGSLTAGTGNIKVASPGSLNVSGAGFWMANRGNINFNTASGDIAVNSTNLYSQQVTLSAGTGNVSASLGQTTGIVNASGCNVDVGGKTQNLIMGNVNALGDPLFFNPGGTFTLDGTITATSGAPLSIVATGNIYSDANSILNTSQSQASGAGGNLTLVAGANFVAPVAGQPLVLKGASVTGGLIDLTGASHEPTDSNFGPVATISTNGGSSSGNAGTIVTVAYAKSGTGALGQIINGTAMTATSSGGTGGAVTMIGGAISGDSINNTGTINTVGTTGGGSVSIYAAMPKGNVSIESVTGVSGGTGGAGVPGGVGGVGGTGGSVTTKGAKAPTTDVSNGTNGANGTGT